MFETLDSYARNSVTEVRICLRREDEVGIQVLKSNCNRVSELTIAVAGDAERVMTGETKVLKGRNASVYINRKFRIIT
jgi:hypothetical protein